MDNPSHRGAPRAERVRSLLRAQAVYNNGNASIDCVVRNMSDSGARIETPNQTALPGEFDLHVPHKGRTYRARIVWRKATEAGVQFVDHAAQPNSEAGGEIETLRVENAQLRARVIQLQKRIRDLEDRSSPI